MGVSDHDLAEHVATRQISGKASNDRKKYASAIRLCRMNTATVRRRCRAGKIRRAATVLISIGSPDVNVNA